jgi:hypothetical protein
MMEVFDVRRANLRELIASKFEGNRSAFSRAAGKNVNLINLSLTTNLELRRNIGEKLARDIESACGLPENWMDTDHAGSHSDAAIVSIPRLRTQSNRKDMVPDRLYVSAGWLSSVMPGASSSDNLTVWHVHDDTMAPTLSDGDVAIIDAKQNQMVDGVYLLDYSGTNGVRRVQRNLDGTYLIKPDNPRYESATVDPRKQKNVKVIGRLLMRLRADALT